LNEKCLENAKNQASKLQKNYSSSQYIASKQAPGIYNVVTSGDVGS
jgi:hypothetical protein